MTRGSISSDVARGTASRKNSCEEIPALPVVFMYVVSRREPEMDDWLMSARTELFRRIDSMYKYVLVLHDCRDGHLKVG